MFQRIVIIIILFRSNVLIELRVYTRYTSVHDHDAHFGVQMIFIIIALPRFSINYYLEYNYLDESKRRKHHSNRFT